MKWLAEFSPYYSYVVLLVLGIRWLATASDQSLSWRCLLMVGGAFILATSLILLPVVLAVDVSAIFRLGLFRLSHPNSANMLGLNVCALGAAAICWGMVTHPEQWWRTRKGDDATYDLAAAQQQTSRLVAEAYAAGIRAGQARQPSPRRRRS